jgi:hypothetical protein
VKICKAKILLGVLSFFEVRRGGVKMFLSNYVGGGFGGPAIVGVL